MIPNVLVCFHSRPMSAGLFHREGFRQAGCNVKVAGPGTPSVYGKGDGSGIDHTFDANDYVPPDFELPNEPIDAGELEQRVTDAGFKPDLIFICDQYDPFHLTGKAKAPFAYLCVENWGQVYAERYTQAQAAFWFYQIAHSQEIPFPRDDFEWMPFGFDPHIHKYLPNVPRDKWAIQVGSAYEPRPQVWNHLRQVFDGAPSVSTLDYHNILAESEHTLFGRIPSYEGMAIAHNRAKVALSSSNCDFSPMRTCEAYGMGALLVSDDVPAIRAVLGPPESEGGFWVAHDRTLEGTERAVRRGVEIYDDVIDRGIAHVYRYHTYRNRAERILERAGLKGACRVA